MPAPPAATCSDPTRTRVPASPSVRRAVRPPSHGSCFAHPCGPSSQTDPTTRLWPSCSTFEGQHPDQPSVRSLSLRCERSPLSNTMRARPAAFPGSPSHAGRKPNPQKVRGGISPPHLQEHLVVSTADEPEQTPSAAPSITLSAPHRQESGVFTGQARRSGAGAGPSAHVRKCPVRRKKSSEPRWRGSLRALGTFQRATPDQLWKPTRPNDRHDKLTRDNLWISRTTTSPGSGPSGRPAAGVGAHHPRAA